MSGIERGFPPVIIAESPAGTATTTSQQVTMSGASAPLVAANTARLLVRVSSAALNAPAAIRTDGGAAALDFGIPIPPGVTVEISGDEAQQAMTQIGNSGQILTLTTGFAT